MKLSRKTVYDTWVRSFPGTKTPTYPDFPDMPVPGGGSDHAGFLNFLGIPVVDFRYRNTSWSEYPLYHSLYETPFISEHIFDTNDFAVHKAVGQFWAELARKFADQPIIPLNISILAEQLLNNYVHDLKGAIEPLKQKYPEAEDARVQLSHLIKHCQHFVHRARQVESEIASLRQPNHDSVNNPDQRISQLSRRLMKVERCFINPNARPVVARYGKPRQMESGGTACPPSRLGGLLRFVAICVLVRFLAGKRIVRLKTYNTTDAIDCGTECALTINCTAFQIIRETGECNLLAMLRNYYFQSSQCGYYLKKSPGVTVVNRTLSSDIDVAFQNAVYDLQGPCPIGWKVLTDTCLLKVPKNTCSEFAPFLESRYDFACLIPIMIVEYSCPDSTYTLGSYTDGHYCIKLIPKWSADTDIGNMKPYEFANQYCYNQTGGYLASIHSKAENDDINTIQKTLTETLPGVMIGLVANSSTLTNTDDMYWLDGTGLSYTNYVDLSNDVFTFTLMTNNGKWKTTMDPLNAKKLFKYVACKQNAFATMTKKLK